MSSGSKIQNQHLDQLLQVLAAIPEKTSLEIAITLNVGGLIVSGRIISQQAYFKELKKLIKLGDKHHEIKEILEDLIIQFQDQVRRHEEEAVKLPLPEFIHLKNAKMYPSHGRGMPSTREAIWRGRISEVGGFSLGEILYDLDQLQTTPFSEK